MMLPELGSVILVKRADYYLGNEDLTLRLHSIADGKPVHHNEEWVSIEGTALNTDGSDRGYRSALVRLAALNMPQENIGG